MIREDIRNIAIIAHVDHGKTTLVDEMLKQSGVFRANQVVQDRVMDSGDIERERGITILAKNTAVFYENTKINVVDTPGHADFGGEVERVLKMVNGVLLLVDAAEGPMPQTRFVLQKALDLNLRAVIVVNKIDRPDARLKEVEDEILELLIELDADDDQLDSPIVYCSARQGVATLKPDEEGEDLRPLFETILTHVPAPGGDETAPFQMLVSSIDFNEYVGRIAIGRVERGEARPGMEIAVCDYYNSAVAKKAKLTNLYIFEGLRRMGVESAQVGDIICLSGVEDIAIGNTICAPEAVEPLAFVKISEPTVEMTFSVNDSPFAGKEGKYVTSRHLRERLYREAFKDLSLKVTDTDTTEAFNVMGRGEMHLSILIETMRRDGYEFQVSTPRVLFREVDGDTCEPMELLTVDTSSQSVGIVMEKLGSRRGELQRMTPMGERMRLEFVIPARGLFGYRSEFLTDTRGEGLLSSVFHGYAPVKGDIPRRSSGSLIAFETGDAVAYGLFNAQERGPLFIGPGTAVYAGMVVGYSPKGEDITVNVCRKKHVTNVRAAGSDDALRLTPPQRLTLEESLEFIGDDELLEVTPENLRIRKRILDHTMRMRKGR